MSDQKLIIVRGLPGSGKSTLAASFGLPVFSTDNYFMVDGQYRFVPTKLDEYHKLNQQAASEAMAAGNAIVVDNCHSTFWEMKPYVEAAIQMGFTVDFVEPTTPWARNPAECEKRCTHNVPLFAIQRTFDRWEYNPTVEKVMQAQRPQRPPQKKGYKRPPRNNF